MADNRAQRHVRWKQPKAVLFKKVAASWNTVLYTWNLYDFYKPMLLQLNSVYIEFA